MEQSKLATQPQPVTGASFTPPPGPMICVVWSEDGRILRQPQELLRKGGRIDICGNVNHPEWRVFPVTAEYVYDIYNSMDAVYQNFYDSPRPIYAVHSHGMFLRLFYWWMLNHAGINIQEFSRVRNFTYDIVDEFNKPAVLSLNERQSFQISDIVDFLPDRMDPDNSLSQRECLVRVVMTFLKANSN